MKLRNILMAVATMGVMFASADRTGVVGYTAGDYDDMNKYPHIMPIELLLSKITIIIKKIQFKNKNKYWNQIIPLNEYTNQIIP